MKTTLLDAKQIGKKLSDLMEEFSEFRWSVAWATNGPHADRLWANKHKIKKLLIGIHFHQTDPEFLRRLLHHKPSAVASDLGNGTFHPKVYHFQSRTSAAAIVGSANFTASGTTKNKEAAVFLEGDVNDPILQNIRKHVEFLWKEEGAAIDKAFLTSYEAAHAVAGKHRDALKHLRHFRPTKKARHPEILLWSWDQYARIIRATDRFDGRLAVIDAATDLFDRRIPFWDFSSLERKAIAGFIGKSETNTNAAWKGLDWKWFGSMQGAGSFKQLINNNADEISDALEEIPLRGDVSKADCSAFMDLFQKAFVRSSREGGIATATRLLAMKRPDYFVCVDGPNRKGLGDDLGFAPSTLNLDKYWDAVIAPLRESSWYQARRPVGRNAKLWDYRMAMVDALYYEPD